MQRREENVAARLNGNSLQPLSDVSITVIDDKTGLPASLYSDNGVTPLAQPIKTDLNGYYGYYAANGEYTETFTSLRIATFTRKVVLADPDDNPAVTKGDLAAGTGSTLVSFTQAGAGAAARTLQDRLRDVVSAKDFGAKLDGITDDTAAWQAAVDAMPIGATLDGLGLASIVTSIYFKSGCNYQNLRLFTKPGAVDGVSPVTIDGRTVPKSKMRFRNVYVDGQRAQQTNILGTAGEDGARHGVRMLGRVSDILFEDCGAINCATDSVEMYSAGVSVSDSDPAFRNITFRNFIGGGSRRHTMSVDSFADILIDGCTLYGSGLDLNSTDVATHGNRGARVGNSLANPVYGSCIDFEGYGVGSGFDGLRINNSKLTGSARSALIFYDTAAQNAPGFVARRNIWITNCTLDAGVDASSSGNAIEFTSTTANKTLGALYKNIYMQNNKLTGGILARAVSNLRISGGEVNAPGTYYAALDNATGVQLATNQTGAAKSVYADASSFTEDKSATPFPSSPTLAYASGTAGTLANVVYTQRENRRNGAFTFFITADWTPTAGGDTVLALTPPAGASIGDPAIVNVINNNTGLLVLAGHNPVSTYVRFTNAGASVMHKVQILVTVNA